MVIFNITDRNLKDIMSSHVTWHVAACCSHFRGWVSGVCISWISWYPKSVRKTVLTLVRIHYSVINNNQSVSYSTLIGGLAEKTWLPIQSINNYLINQQQNVGCIRLLLYAFLNFTTHFSTLCTYIHKVGIGSEITVIVWNI